MTDAQAIRARLDEAQDSAAKVQLACDAAVDAMRVQNENRLRIYLACVESEGVRMRVAIKRALQALNRMPLDGLLIESLKAKGAANGQR